MQQNCPLCNTNTNEQFYSFRERRFFHCSLCHSAFVHPHDRPDSALEKQEYDQHNNDPQDEGYRRFLSRIISPLKNKVIAPASGLDFGCGPGPALAQMLSELGYEVALYDPFYYSDRSVLDQQYDFVTCTEVVEHLHQPNKTLAEIWQLIKPYGWLAIMTQRMISQERFKQWTYKNDPTHVFFFSDQTFHWLADHLQANALEFVDRDIVLLQKSAES